MLKRKRKAVRFIPFRKQDVVNMCLRDGELTEDEQTTFRQLIRLLESSFHFEFHQRLERLKNAYAPLNPSRDTRVLETEPSEDSLALLLDELLNYANYDKLKHADLEAALAQSSLFNLQLEVDFSEFAEVAVYTRGQSERREMVPRFLGLFPKPVTFQSYDRVVLFIRFADQLKDSTFNKPGSTILKLFHNVPTDDVEMLFPNTRLGMRLVDKLILGVPAVVGGGIVLSTKMGASLILLGGLLGFYVGLRSEPVHLDQAALIALVAALGTFGSFVWRQFGKFKTRKLSFMQRLMENLYFRNLDNNAGVFHRLIDDAEEEECKEAILAYYFLLTRPAIRSQALLDDSIESWFKSEWQADVDFEIMDALGKLERLGLVYDDPETGLAAVPLQAALEKLDARWDEYFTFREADRKDSESHQPR
ncbi:MAG: TMEM143 family protein [Pseudomonadales bacterium]